MALPKPPPKTPQSRQHRTRTELWAMKAFLNSDVSDVLALFAMIAFLSTAFVLLGAFAGAF
jgi:hypothetical protein